MQTSGAGRHLCGLFRAYRFLVPGGLTGARNRPAGRGDSRAAQANPAASRCWRRGFKFGDEPALLSNLVIPWRSAPRFRPDVAE